MHQHDHEKNEKQIDEIDKLDLRKTSLSPEPSTSDPEVVLSDGEVAIATSRAEKLLIDAGGGSGDAGILRKSSKAVCPVMDKSISKNEAAASNLTRDYRDHIYYLCCNTCARLWDKHPEKYANL